MRQTLLALNPSLATCLPCSQGRLHRLSLLFALLAAPLILGCSGDSNDNGEGVAIEAAKSFVRDSLITPATASFPWDPNKYAATKSRRCDSCWIVEGYVDAQNLFGANIRYKWVVDIEDAPHGWTLHAILIR